MPWLSPSAGSAFPPILQLSLQSGFTASATLSRHSLSASLSVPSFFVWTHPLTGPPLTILRVAAFYVGVCSHPTLPHWSAVPGGLTIGVAERALDVTASLGSVSIGK